MWKGLSDAYSFFCEGAVIPELIALNPKEWEWMSNQFYEWMEMGRVLIIYPPPSDRDDLKETPKWILYKGCITLFKEDVPFGSVRMWRCCPHILVRQINMRTGFNEFACLGTGWPTDGYVLKSQGIDSEISPPRWENRWMAPKSIMLSGRDEFKVKRSLRSGNDVQGTDGQDGDSAKSEEPVHSEVQEPDRQGEVVHRGDDQDSVQSGDEGQRNDSEQTVL